MLYAFLAKAFIVTGILIVFAGFVLHFLTPASLYGRSPYAALPLAARTIAPALAYGITLLLVGVAYLRPGSLCSYISISLLLTIVNAVFIFSIYHYIDVSYSVAILRLHGSTVLLDIYFFIAQTLVYPWIIANTAGALYIYYVLKTKGKEGETLGRS